MSDEASGTSRPSRLLLAAAVLTALPALLYVLGLFAGDDDELGGMTWDLFALGALVLLVPGLLASALGLALGKSWGYLGAVGLLVANCALCARYAAPALELDWSHPRAGDVFRESFARETGSLLVSVIALVLLALRPVRIAAGVSSAPYRRTRRVAGRRG